MRKIVFTSLISLLLLLPNVSAQTDQTGWIEFAPQGAGFSILMPNKPVETISEKPAFTMHTFVANAGRGTYVASYTDYKADPKRVPATFLAANRDKFNKGLQAKLISSREITLDGHAGLEFTSETPAANVKSQLFMIGNRMFQTATVVFKDTEQTAYVNRFFESFKFKPAAEPH